MDEHAKAEFWQEVIRELKKRRVSDNDAEKKVCNYKSAMEKQGVGELVFHQEPAEVAAALACK